MQMAVCISDLLLTLALEDIAVRYHRLKGDRTLFVPGADQCGL